jgi:hypothetical protein
MYRGSGVGLMGIATGVIGIAAPMGIERPRLNGRGCWPESERRVGAPMTIRMIPTIITPVKMMYVPPI